MGARAAGLRHLWGIEIRDDVAQVARDNGFNVITADVHDVDPHTLERPDVLHMSLPCLDASNANGDVTESEAGKELGRVGARYIEILCPRVVTLENVYYYRHYEAFKAITEMLSKLGYIWDFDNLCAADYGVPQTRRRLMLRAVRGSLLPMLPWAERWRGWYASIEDLIDTLPESKFASWQLKRLPASLDRSVLVSNGGYEGRISMRSAGKPVFTITANQNQLDLRAFIVSGSNSGNYGIDKLTIRRRDKPVFTITASTTQAVMRAVIKGRVVRMTVRALARFQSFPDSYKLPAPKRLAGYVIGNAVPPLMYEKIISQFIGYQL